MVGGKGGHERDETGQPRSSRFAGLAAALATLRSIPGRLRRPEALLMVMALLASVGAHMPPYVGLGALADYFASHPEPSRVEPVEVSFEVSDPEPTPPPDKPKPDPRIAESEPEKPKAPPPDKPKPKPPPKKIPKVALAEPLPKPPPPSQQRKQSVTQKSDDPNQEPPPDAKFLAEENRRVEEETVARVTDEMRDDNELSEGAQRVEGPPDPGDSERSERGQSKGAQDGNEVQVAKVPRSQRAPSQAPERPARPRPSGAPSRPAEQAMPEVIQDPMGSFTLAPAKPAKAGRRGRAGRRGKAPPDLRVSWEAFEQTFGEEQLARDRMPKLARSLGAGREKRWSEFKAAIENYITGVKPGNTTALNAAADPFAAYIASFHRHLHMEFAYQFLASLPAMGEFADPSLMTKVEIVVNPDGTLDRVGVVKSSGNMMYDFGAFNAVQRGAPYPPPPEKIRSPDGRVYMRWALHRNASQCGTWNAEPYILQNPPRSPHDPRPDNLSPYRSPGFDPRDSEHGEVPKPEPGKGGPAVKAGETLGWVPSAPGHIHSGHELFAKAGAAAPGAAGLLVWNGR